MQRRGKGGRVGDTAVRLAFPEDGVRTEIKELGSVCVLGGGGSPVIEPE